jgi:hypothetical protein
MLGHHHSPGCRRLFRLVFLGQLFSQLTLAINNFLEIMEIFSPPQLVPSGLTTGTLSTCRRMSSEGMSLSDIAILLASQWQYLICIWNLLALNIRMVTAKNSSQHLNPCMLMFSDFAWRLLKSSHDQNWHCRIFSTLQKCMAKLLNMPSLFSQVGVYNISNCKSTFWHRPIRQRYHYLDRNVAPVSIIQ